MLTRNLLSAIRAMRSSRGYTVINVGGLAVALAAAIMNGFGDRISLHAGWFLSAGLAALLIAILTVGGHALRASRRNPIQALRYE